MLGRPTPRSFSIHAARRFAAERRVRYAARIAGPPTDTQAALIQSMIAMEWTAIRNEAAGTLASDKVAVNARRLFQRLLGEFERSLKSVPAERPPTLAEHLGKLAARREGTTA
jgi:hypothetical protein